MFSANVSCAKTHQLAEKWTSPRPPRERLPFFHAGRATLCYIDRTFSGRHGKKTPDPLALHTPDEREMCFFADPKGSGNRRWLPQPGKRTYDKVHEIELE